MEYDQRLVEVANGIGEFLENECRINLPWESQCKLVHLVHTSVVSVIAYVVEHAKDV